LPFVVHVGQDRADEADDGGVAGEDAVPALVVRVWLAASAARGVAVHQTCGADHDDGQVPTIDLLQLLSALAADDPLRAAGITPLAQESPASSGFSLASAIIGAALAFPSGQDQ
jgi:hypothetical protein